MTEDLPLLYKTPPSWAKAALCDPLALLNDHAHLERKAAGNALELVGRWPEATAHNVWVKMLTAIAKDEVNHFSTVVKLLEAKGGTLSRSHRNIYAQDLRAQIRYGRGNDELIDRLLGSALIEARSAERFELLAKEATDPQLSKLYRGLWASERGHYTIFHDLAESVKDRSIVEKRWQELLKAEAKIIQNQKPGARMHSGCG